MLSLKYLYRNLVKLGRPGDQALADQAQLETVRQVPVAAGADLSPLTQVRRSLITVYQSGRTCSKSTDHITRAVYKEWRYRSSEYPDVKAPLQTACSSIAAGVNSADALEMEAVNGMIDKVHALLVSIGFLSVTAYHLIAVLIVIEANPLQVFTVAAVPETPGLRNPLFPMDRELRPYRVQVVDEVYLCQRFLEANRDLLERMRREWDVFRRCHAEFARDLEQRLSGPTPNRASLKAILESIGGGRELADLPLTYRPYMLALAALSSGVERLKPKASAAAVTSAASGGSSAIDGSAAGHRVVFGRRKAAVNSGKLLVQQLSRIRSVSSPKVCVQ